MRPPPAFRRRAFVDSSAYYALTDAHDRTHADARAIRDRLIAERWRLVTTNFILAETHGARPLQPAA